MALSIVSALAARGTFGQLVPGMLRMSGVLGVPGLRGMAGVVVGRMVVVAARRRSGHRQPGTMAEDDRRATVRRDANHEAVRHQCTNGHGNQHPGTGAATEETVAQ